MVNKKITIVGAGKVGATVAQSLAYKNFADIVLVNRTVEKAQGIALDLMQSAPVEGFDVKVTGTGDYRETKNSDVVVITAGLPRKEGMSRDELVAANTDIVKGITKELAKYSPKAVMIVVTNPLDVMTYVAWKVSGFKTNKVVGMAGILDTSRFRYFLSEELKVSPKDVSTVVLGGHGDFMLPLINHTFVKGKPIPKLLSNEKIDKIVKRTVDAGAEIIKREGDSAYYTPASSVVQMVECFLNNEKKTLPCSAYLNGEYGIKGVFIGVPVKLGKNGAEKIIELDLTSEEKEHLQNSANKIKEMIKITGM